LLLLRVLQAARLQGWLILSFEKQIYEKIDEMLELGHGILLRVDSSDLQIGYYENLLRSLKTRYPQVHLHCFSAPEILCIAEVSEISVRETIQRLMDAGLQSIPGGGREILDDEVRAKNCPSEVQPARTGKKCIALHIRLDFAPRPHDVRLRRRAAPSREPSRKAAANPGGYRRFTASSPGCLQRKILRLGKKIQETTASII